MQAFRKERIVLLELGLGKWLTSIQFKDGMNEIKALNIIIFPRISQLPLADGQHPTPEGHELLAARVAPQVTVASCTSLIPTTTGSRQRLRCRRGKTKHL
jgi:hypothetical protein